MSSIIEGYNYDIFISYRQKDNKGDRWVSEFVEALKTELESTFKEDISIYFDENPHDRLQETHNVDKSLESKLKCLIFIPILSQTYCDPNSYAWQNEFLTFVKMAENDRFGKDVKLRSGNVASRILPVRIHDLEQEDIKLFEKETRSVLRAMDFIFKTTTGVSRPLLSNEDHPNDNLNKTFYRDQINKVAHEIKEIILGMRAQPVQVVKEKDQTKESTIRVREDETKIDLEKPTKTVKSKLIFLVAIIAMLIIAVIFVYPKFFKRATLEKLRSSGERISVVVMPFQNMTGDTTKNIWQDIIQDNLISSLSNSEELKVRREESINNLVKGQGIVNYASITPSVARTVSQKLNANVLIYGSIKKAASTIRLNSQLIDPRTMEVFKSFQIESLYKEENIFHLIDSLSVMVRNFLVISELERGIHKIYKLSGMTNSPKAYRYFIQGRNEYMKENYMASINSFSKAIACDSNFFQAIISTSLAYNNQYEYETWFSSVYDKLYLYEEAKKWCLRAYRKMDKMNMQQKITTQWIYARLFETKYEEIMYLEQLIESDDQLVTAYFNLGNSYNESNQYEKAIPEYEKALKIYEKWGLKPYWAAYYTYLGQMYHKTGQYKKEEKVYKTAEKDFPDDPELIGWQGILALSQGDTTAANRYFKRLSTILRNMSLPEATITALVAFGYNEAGIQDKAEKYYRLAQSLESDNPDRVNILAYFLIDKERNINEGVELIDKVLEEIPENFIYLHTKGWGLYKQGKYKEALEILQKSWDLRRQLAVYDHEAYLHLEAAKRAVAGQKNN
jgi:tetratricopeptide (TPR) repeat protein